MTSWSPKFDSNEGSGPKYEQLVSLLIKDINAGIVETGQLLPPQRQLAADLGVSIGTVARAYKEAETRGLVSGRVGHGTEVIVKAGQAANTPDQPMGLSALGGLDNVAVNLSENEPSAELSHGALSSALSHPAFTQRLKHETGYAPPAGRPSHRRLLSGWIERYGSVIPWESTLVCHGAHHGLSLALRALCRESDVVLVEGNTYFGFVALARSLGLHLAAVPMDDEGMRADKFEEIAAQHPGSVLYVMPTLHNPTTRTMGEIRRHEVAKIAQKYDIKIVEDDTYRALADAPPTPLLQLAPERTINVVGLSKVIAPSLRTGCIAIPDAALFRQVMRVAQAESHAASSLAMTLSATLLETGLAQAARDQLVADTQKRLRIVEQVFASDVIFESASGAHHIWLPMTGLDAERVCFEALRTSIALTPPTTLGFDSNDAGLRICTGACSLSELSSSLAIIRSLIA